MILQGNYLPEASETSTQTLSIFEQNIQQLQVLQSRVWTLLLNSNIHKQTQYIHMYTQKTNMSILSHTT